MDEHDVQVFEGLQATLNEVLRSPSHAALPSPSTLRSAAGSLPKTLSDNGQSLEELRKHVVEDVVPGLNGSSLSRTYYGFVTGGITPAARLAESVVSLYDQNVSVHLPEESVATIVEDRALSMVLELLDFEPKDWPARTFTTGATSSNLLGLACAREYVISERLTRNGLDIIPGEGKAANIIGLGSESLIDVSQQGSILTFDMPELERRLAAPDTASIIVISCGEVNAGLFATTSLEEVQAIRALCDKYGAWLHVDGAFGIFARALPKTPAYAALHAGTSGLHLADSIGSDAHKLLNVPYDAGLFFSTHAALPARVFRNTNAAYLAGGGTDLPSPLNVRIENSSRFRGLPVYASLVAYGRQGHAAMFERMVVLARRIAAFVRDECAFLELLPAGVHEAGLDKVHICVLFRARDEALNEALAAKIKASRRIHVSGTVWDGRSATRIAVAKWNVDVERDLAVVKEVLKSLK